MLLPMRVTFRRNTVSSNADNQGSNQHEQSCPALDNFIKGRRSSAGVAMSSSLLHQEMFSRSLARHAGRRRSIDQVRHCITIFNSKFIVFHQKQGISGICIGFF